MQTAIGGAGTLFGPLVGATVWLYLSDFFQTTLHLGATWKLVLGVVFVLLVCFLRRGIVGGIADLWTLVMGGHSDGAEPDDVAAVGAAAVPKSANAAAVPEATHAAGRKAIPGRSCKPPASQSVTAASAPTATSISPSSAGAARYHRAERSGQEHLLQDAHLRSAANRGPDRVRRPRHHAYGRHRRVPTRADEELPGQPAVHASDGARECHYCRAGGAARQIPPRHVPRPGAHPRTQRAGRARSNSSISPDGPMRRSRRSPMARSGGWRSGWPPPIRAFCCSTSRLPA